MIRQENSLKTFKKVKNIIFDMDGTLVDTARATVEACQRTALIFGLPVRQALEITGQIGWANPEFYIRLYPDVKHDVLYKYIDETEALEKQIINELGQKNLFPGVLELLKFLKSRDYYLAVASTGSLDHVECALGASGIVEMFNMIHCGESEKDMMVGRIISQKPDESWMIVGDKDKDAKAGRKNSIITVAARYGFGTYEEYELFDHSIFEPLELINLLGY